MSRQHWYWLVGLPAAVAVAGAAHAQSYAPQSAAGRGLQRMAGASATAADQTLLPGVMLAVRGAYDTDVGKSRTVFAGQPIQEEDETLTPNGTINLARQFGPASLFLAGSGSYDFYRLNPFLNRWHVNFEGGGKTQIGPCSTTVSGAFARLETDLAELDVAAPNYENQETVGLEGTCQRAIGFTPEFSVSQGWLQNSSTQRRILDRRMFMSEGGVTYNHPAIGQVTLFVDYDDSTYPNLIENVAGTPFTDGFHIYSGGVRFTRMLGARIQGQAELAYQSLQPTIPNATAFNGLTYLLSLSYKPTSRLTGVVLLSRQSTPSQRLGATFSTNDVYSGDLSYLVGARITAEVGVDYRHRQFGDLTQFASQDFTTDNVVTAHTSLSYAFGKRLQTVLSFDHTSREANVASFGYTSNKVSLSLETRF